MMLVNGLSAGEGLLLFNWDGLDVGVVVVMERGS